MLATTPTKRILNAPTFTLVIGLCGVFGGCDDGSAVTPAELATPATAAPVMTVAEHDEIVDASADAAFAGFAGTADAPDVRGFAAGELPAGLGRGPDALVTPPLSAPGEINEPAGFGHYCSMTWGGGGWAYAWDTNGGDPCGYLISQFGAGTVRKAGLFSAAGSNEAVVWCDGQSWGPAIYRGAGGAPLSAAFNASVASGEPNCVMTVSSLALPIFERSPSTGLTSAGTGVDFAREGAPMLDTGPFGATGADDNSSATQVNFKGHARTNFVEDHDGWDWSATENTDLFALAAGKVIANRDYQTSAVACATAEAAKKKSQALAGCINRDFPAAWPAPCTSWGDSSAGCTTALATGNYIDYRNAGWDGNLQGEVYIRHRVVTSPSTYSESFVVGYFHVKRGVSPAVGTNVTMNTQIGDVGNGGWTSGPHLHMTVIRETNVGTPNIKDRTFVVNPDNCTNCAQGSHNFHRYAVDPFGWQAPQHIDPRGWATKDGAMSPKLWKPGITLPPSTPWGN